MKRIMAVMALSMIWLIQSNRPLLNSDSTASTTMLPIPIMASAHSVDQTRSASTAGSFRLNDEFGNQQENKRQLADGTSNSGSSSLTCPTSFTNGIGACKCDWANDDMCKFDNGNSCWCSCCCMRRKEMIDQGLLKNDAGSTNVPYGVCENPSINNECMIPSELTSNKQKFDYTKYERPIDMHGRLRISESNKLIDKRGKEVQLVGVSTSALHWHGNCYTKENIAYLVKEWGINVFRVSVFVGEGGYERNPQAEQEMIINIINWCEELGIYVIIDWHDVSNGDPNTWLEWKSSQKNTPYSLSDAKTGVVVFPTGIAIDFWIQLSSLCKEKNHVIYEIGSKAYGVSWATMVGYYNAIIGTIRVIDPSSIIIIGTPDWNTDILSATTKSNGVNIYQKHNVMLSLSIWSGDNEGISYIDNLFDQVDKLSQSGYLPVIVTEFGTSMPSGNGGPFILKSYYILEKMRKSGISWIMANFKDDDVMSGEKSSSLLKMDACSTLPSITNQNLTCSGSFASMYVNQARMIQAQTNFIVKSESITLRSSATSTFIMMLMITLLSIWI